jgi:Leucine-rich repeat (LRR) protein
MLNLSYDWFREEVPVTINRLAHLQVLDLSYNAFSGSCVSLLVLSLSRNHIHGRIPVELGNRLSNLRGLLVANNILRSPS